MKTVVDLVTALKEYFLGKDKDVEKIIAPVEADATSSAAAHAIGDQIIVDNLLYNVTAAIAVGDSLTVGTNISLSNSVAEQLETINNSVAEQLETINTTLGNTDISEVGNSVTAAISSLNNGLTNTNNKIGNTDISAIGNSVTAAISSLNSNFGSKTFGTKVNVTNYTSTNKFTAPNDGIIELNGGNTGAFIRCSIDDATFCNPTGYSPYAGSSITPIKKGQKFCVLIKDSAHTSQSAYYYPYV